MDESASNSHFFLVIRLSQGGWRTMKHSHNRLEKLEEHTTSLLSYTNTNTTPTLTFQFEHINFAGCVIVLSYMVLEKHKFPCTRCNSLNCKTISESSSLYGSGIAVSLPRRHSAPTQTIDDIMHGHNDAIALPKKHINIFRYRRKLNVLAYSLFIQVVASQLCTLWCSIENCSNISKQYYRLQYVSINIYWACQIIIIRLIFYSLISV